MKVDYVAEDEYETIVRKLCENEDLANNLIECVEKHEGNIKNLLCTPLMITVLVITYKSFQKVPEQLSEFFEDMFHTMLRRHDGTKPAYTRERACNLNDFQYQAIFEALCYVTKEKGLSFKQGAMNDNVQNAIKLAKIEADSQKYTYDINKITCLLIYEGREYRFLHKSLQEYFAASYIKNKPDAVSAKIYGKLLEDGYKWNEELLYLEEIDNYKFLKYFFVPLCKKYLDVVGKKVTKKIDNKNLDIILQNTKIFKISIENPIYGYAGTLRLLFSTSRLKPFGRNIIIKNLYTNRYLLSNSDRIVDLMSEVSNGFKASNLKHLSDNKVCVETLKAFGNDVFDVIDESVIDAQKQLRVYESTDCMNFMLD